MIEFPAFWCRLPDSTTKEMMTIVCRLFCKPLRSKTQLCPLGVVCIIDPMVKWFEKWFISSYGRQLLLPIMIETGLLARFATVTLTALDRLILNVSNKGNPLKPNSIDISDVEYLKCAHCLIVLGRTLLYDQGRRCMPITTGVSFSELQSELLKRLFVGN